MSLPISKIKRVVSQLLKYLNKGYQNLCNIDFNIYLDYFYKLFMLVD